MPYRIKANTGRLAVKLMRCELQVLHIQAPVPLTGFRSNSKFDQNLWCSSLKKALPITTKLCTCHDSVTVVTCAKYHCDRLRTFQIRALQILIEFRIRSNTVGGTGARCVDFNHQERMAMKDYQRCPVFSLNHPHDFVFHCCVMFYFISCLWINVIYFPPCVRVSSLTPEKWAVMVSVVLSWSTWVK